MYLYAREKKGKEKDSMPLLSLAALFQLPTVRRGLRTPNTVHYSSQSFNVAFKNAILKLEKQPLPPRTHFIFNIKL